jgi:predicted nucleic acid-binding protein
MRGLIDTSAIIAILNKRDKNHSVALRLIRQGRADGLMFSLTNFLAGEVYATLLTRVGAYAARICLAENDIPIIRVTSGDEMRAREILFKYTDKDFSYVDATSFAVMERLQFDVAFSFDEHFKQYGLTMLG